jgi:hypothetical protein
MVIRVGSSLGGKRRTDEEGRLQARGIYKEVLRPSRGLALAAIKRSLTPTVLRPLRIIKIYLS